MRRCFYVGTPHRGAPLERAGRLLTRVLGAIPVLGVLFSLADGLLLIFGERRRSLHDVMADTIVIDERA